MSQGTVEGECWVHGSSLEYSNFLFSTCLKFSLIKRAHTHTHTIPIPVSMRKSLTKLDLSHQRKRSNLMALSIWRNFVREEAATCFLSLMQSTEEE